MNCNVMMELLNSGDFITMRYLLEKEVKEQSAKAAGGVTQLKRLRTANKFIKDVPSHRDGLKTAFMQEIDGVDYQCFCNGLTAAILVASGQINDVVDLREHKYSKPFILASVVAPKFFTGTTIDFDIPAIIARDRSKIESNRNEKQIDIGVRHFNTRIILPIITILGGTIECKDPDGNANNPLFLHSENGYAIILPFRK